MTSRVLLGITGVGICVLLALALVRAQAPPEGPVPVALDREACARCRMLVSELGFAAQVHTHDGRVHHFDDPGCLFLWNEAHASEAAVSYFHHLEDERWLEASRAVFVAADPTPMGYGLAARERGESPGRSIDEARALVVERERERGREEVADVRRP